MRRTTRPGPSSAHEKGHRENPRCPFAAPGRMAGTRPSTVLLLLTVAVAELVHLLAHAALGALAREERVARGGYVDLDQRVLVTVFPLDGLLRLHGRTGQDGEIRRDVLEYHRLVVRVNA